MHGAVAVVVALAADEAEPALALGEQMARGVIATLTATDDAFRIGWPDAVEAALRRGRPPGGPVAAVARRRRPGGGRTAAVSRRSAGAPAGAGRGRRRCPQPALGGRRPGGRPRMPWGAFVPLLVGCLRARAGRLAARPRRPGAGRVTAGRRVRHARTAQGGAGAGAAGGGPSRGWFAAREDNPRSSRASSRRPK